MPPERKLGKLRLAILPLLAGLFFEFGVTQNAFAYPNFIGFGYKSCIVCHYNPAGGGPLTDYGRATGATVIAAKPFYNPKASDDDLGRQSQFFGTLVDLPDWIRPFFNYRGLYYNAGVQASNPTRDWIQMQADGSLTLKTKDGKWLATGTLGYIPPPLTATPAQASQYSTLISREHYLSYRPSKYFDVEAGYMDQDFGIHSPDHEDFFRQKIELDQADQTYALQAHIAGKTWETYVQAQAGDLNQTSAIQQKGGSVVFEHDAFDDSRIGASLLATKSDFRTREMAAVHGRFGFPEGSAILSEFGFDREFFPTTPRVLREFAFVQPYVNMTRGLFLFFTLEYYSMDNYTKVPANYEVGPGLQYFPLDRLELRFDFVTDQTLGQSTIDTDIYSLLFQVHVWL